MPTGHDLLEFHIDGRWVGRGNRDVHAVLNPANGETIGELPLATTADLDEALEAAQRGFKAWKGSTAAQRSAVLRKAAALVRERRDAIARLLIAENGKPYGEAMWELAFTADVLDWFAEESQRIYGRVLPSDGPGNRRMVLKEPLGPVAGFSPWNVPVLLTTSKIAGAVAAGCSIIVKPAEETPGAILAVMRILDEVGLPAGVVNMVFGVPSNVSTHLIASPVIRKVSFTGSTAVGKQIAALAAPGLKRVTLELGGHAPTIIFDDADLEQAANMLAEFKFFNAGQICFTPTRFYIHENVHDRFLDIFSEKARALKVGPGLEEGVNMGPLANARRTKAMDELIADAIETGATVSLGGFRHDGPGNFFAPTILSDVPSQARIMREEPFGPVALTSRFKTMDEAIERANALPYGLSAFVFTRSARTATLMTDALESGTVGINTCMVAAADAPFGGVKDSGYGLDFAHEGVDAYCATKFVNHLAV